jgi:hypothetical protein
MNIYKLKYVDKESAIADLIAKNVIEILEDGQFYINGTESVVECGVITITQATYQGKTELNPAVFADGYHYDIMTTDTIVFDSEIFVNNPKFKFSGY